MKCHNCKCSVSADFKYAFSTNCCPKCGDFLMPMEVKSLYTKIQTFLDKDNHDIGDLANWFVESYLTTTPSISAELDEPSETIVATVTAVDEDDSEMTLAEEEKILTREDGTKIKRTARPIKRINASKDQKLLDPARTNIFSKRAGVDKIKFETIVKDIQGTTNAQDDDWDAPFPEYDGGDDSGGFMDTPLSNREMHEVAGIFESGNSGQTDFTEIEKLQKIEQLAYTGSIGVIKRSS